METGCRLRREGYGVRPSEAANSPQKETVSFTKTKHENRGFPPQAISGLSFEEVLVRVHAGDLPDFGVLGANPYGMFS